MNDDDVFDHPISRIPVVFSTCFFYSSQTGKVCNQKGQRWDSNSSIVSDATILYRSIEKGRFTREREGEKNNTNEFRLDGATKFTSVQ